VERWSVTALGLLRYCLRQQAYVIVARHQPSWVMPVLRDERLRGRTIA